MNLTLNNADPAGNPESVNTPEKLKKQLQGFLLETSDPWQIIRGNLSKMQGTGVNL